MALSPTQQRMLADMGIQLWALRDTICPLPDRSADPAEGQAVAITVDAHIRMLLVMKETRLSEATQRLLNAMLKAISVSPDQVAIFSLAEFSQLDEGSLSGRAVLLMGTEVAQQLQLSLSPMSPMLVKHENTHYSACSSLDELQQQPVAKAAAWQALKQLKKTL